ncbi:MAG: hypothetical protein U1E50_07175 [Caulobacteraceae bacterium]
MRMRLGAVLAAGLLLAGSAAAADTPPASGGPPPANSQQRMHCVEEAETGSFITRRRCYTQEEWDAMQRQAQEDKARADDQRNFMCSAGKGPC